MRKITVCLTAGLALTCASCGHKELYPVSGQVMYLCAPATGAAVFFYRQGGGSMNEHLIMGIVQEDGSFELVSGSLGKGAPPGDYHVLIEWKHDSKPAKGLSQLAARRDRLKGRYSDPKRPRLHAVVQAEPTCLPPFELD